MIVSVIRPAMPPSMAERLDSLMNSGSAGPRLSRIARRRFPIGPSTKIPMEKEIRKRAADPWIHIGFHDSPWTCIMPTPRSTIRTKQTFAIVLISRTVVSAYFNSRPS
jgi:hypothetical protein